MINFNSFSELAEDTKRKMTSFCTYSAKYLSRYDAIVNLIGSVMDKNDVVYSPDIANLWVDDFIKFHNYGDSTRWRYKRIINLLNDNWNNNLECWKIYPVIFRLKPDTDIFNDVVKSFEKYLSDDNYADKTINLRLFSANQFLCWLENNGVYSFDDFNPLLISKYLVSSHFQNRKAGGVSTEIIGLRKFLFYLEDKGIIKANCHKACLNRKNKTRKIVNTYTDEQVDTLFIPLPNSKANLRNKAIFLLALKCGLRSCDIMNLKFENIDFDNKRLNFVQQKTKEPIIIPFDNEVSNALIEYILNERRKSELPYIFLTVSGPIRKLTTANSFQTLLHFKDNDKPLNGGLHILRRTYASNLLNKNVDVSTIAAALGHVGLSTVDRYLSVDQKNMRNCTLSIKQFPYLGGLY